MIRTLLIVFGTNNKAGRVIDNSVTVLAELDINTTWKEIVKKLIEK